MFELQQEMSVFLSVSMFIAVFSKLCIIFIGSCEYQGDVLLLHNMANWWEITDVTIRPIGILRPPNVTTASAVCISIWTTWLELST